MNSESPRAEPAARPAPESAAAGLSGLPAAQPEQAVSVTGLTKTYKAAGKAPAKLALSDVDLDIPRGSLFGLLGPNGAGKSTLINILAGLVNKSSGSAAVWGYDIDRDTRQARAAIGVVPQELNIDPFFTPLELLELQAGLYGVPPAERRSREILAAMGLADKEKAYARTLSGGMRRRLMVAKAMVHQPPVLVLDEPTAGVDIELRQQLWANVRELNRAGTTVLLTTHYLEEAEELCDRIAIINHGKVIACDRTESLLARLDNKALTLIFDRDLPGIPETLTAFNPEQTGPRRLLFHYHASDSPVPQILDAVCGAGLSVIDMSTEETDLEDIFLQLTRGAHDREDSDSQGGHEASA
ncbi:ABC transporter ATP-binding protein [Pelagibius sp.]|uniref:ABC transporter ATP-binding protein n=1 Tax=Pelagibius sp. TaxID=1931238 RepID=UPI00263590B5|nr:ABC transporter ATP-binding protein [Pelagibius sp.]